MIEFEELIDRLEARRKGNEYIAHCPAHDDGTASLSIGHKNGKVLLYCHAGCEVGEVARRLGLSMGDLMPEESRFGVEELAKLKALPVAFLRGLGIEANRTGPGVQIPYRSETGAVIGHKYRLGRKTDSYRWEQGRPLAPYGLDRVKDSKSLVLVEGESDCWTLWFHGFSALGLPGASTVPRTLRLETIRNVEEIYCVKEPDQGGEVFSAALGKHLREMGWKGSLYTVIPEGWKDPSELHCQDSRRFKELFSAALERAKAKAEEGLPVIGIADVPPAPEVAWLVQDLWGAEAVGIVGAEPKAFKSFLALELAVAIASGRPALGQFQVSKGPVLMFNAEDKPWTTRERVRALCLGQGVPIESLNRELVLLNTPGFRLDDSVQVMALEKTVAKVKPKLVVLDPLRDLHVGDENDAAYISGILSSLRLIQRKYHTAVMVIHHMAKGSDYGSGRRPGQRLRGSSVLHGWVDSALYLERQEGAISRVTVEHRGAHPIEPFMFRLNPGEHGALEIKVQDATETMAEDCQEILTLIRKAQHPVPTQTISQKLRSQIRAGAAIKKLTDQGQITHVQYEEAGRGAVFGWIAKDSYAS